MAVGVNSIIFGICNCGIHPHITYELIFWDISELDI